MPLLPDAPLEIIDRVVIAGGNARRQRVTPSLLQLPNGDLLLLYRLGVGLDRVSNGAVMLTRSTDNGHTWDEPVPLFALPGWDCFGLSGLRLLPDGAMICFVAQSRVNPKRGMESSIGLTRTFATRSTDGGRTWSDLSDEIKLFGGLTEFWGHGAILQLSDGRLLLSVLGTEFEYQNFSSCVVYSSDNCQTFHDLTVIADTRGMDFCDTDILRLDDGRLLAVIRTDQPPYDSYQSYSDNDGKTWTPVQPCRFKGQNPLLFRLRSGAILCAYRDRDPLRVGMSCSITEDNGQTWRWMGMLYEGTHWHCGYPDFARLSDGTIFCSYYTSLVKGNSEVQGVYLREK